MVIFARPTVDGCAKTVRYCSRTIAPHCGEATEAFGGDRSPVARPAREECLSVLELINVSKHFGAIHAVNDVSFSLQPGEVVGLMGDNGAGKSTLVKMIAGNFRPTHGSLKMNDTELVMHKPVEA